MIGLLTDFSIQENNKIDHADFEIHKQFKKTEFHRNNLNTYFERTSWKEIDDFDS